MVAGCSAAEAPVRVEFEGGRLTSSEVCGRCHQDIYAFWRDSDHAQSASSRVFQETLKIAEESFGDSIREFCLSCHAPNTLHTADYQLDSSLTREGVGCDFCHSIREMHLERTKQENRFVLDVGTTKYGTFSSTVDAGHETADWPSGKESDICAGCHEYRNSAGVEVLSTFSEWRDYIRSGGQKECRDCHMELSLRGVAEPRAKREATAAVNLHNMADVHSIAKLRRSMRLRILSIRKMQDSLQISIEVANVGAGHKVPTGSPLKKVVLRLDVKGDSGRILSDERHYERVVLDGNGLPLSLDSHILLQAAAIDRDTRIAPREHRVERFEFPLPGSGNLEVRATLTYLYSPHGDPESQIRKVFFTEKKSLLDYWTRFSNR